jgi:hypothetical protein
VAAPKGIFTPRGLRRNDAAWTDWRAADDDWRHEGHRLRIALRGVDDGTGSSVDDVGVSSRRVIDRVTATPRGTTFQRAELCGQAREVQQFDAPLWSKGSRFK